MSDNPFEIPQPIRDMSEQNMKQAHAAYEQLTNFVTKTMNTWMGAMPSNPMTIGFKDVQDRAMDFAKDNAESAFSFAGKICNAQTSQEILLIQTQFAQDRMQAYAEHTQELCGLLGEAFQKLNRP
jgi:hypothetical protein